MALRSSDRHISGGAGRDQDAGAAIAQYLATKITFWGVYRRVLVVTSSHLMLYNPDDFKCTHQWLLHDIIDIEIVPDPNQFILVFEKSRFRNNKVRFQCPARSHLLALVHKLRRQYSFEPIRLSEYDADSRRQHYQCTEHFADDSYDHFLLQVGLAGVTLLDEHGRKVSQFPFVNMQRVAISTAHPDGLVISTMFQERLFLCHPRSECINHMRAAAQALGVNLAVGESPLNMQLLRLRNSQALDNPAVVCFEVEKSVDDGKILQHIQLIFQGTAVIEVHRKMRTIVSRPYSTLLSVVRSDWDADTVVLQFVHGDNLVVRVDSRDQFIAILLLVCREAGNDHVELSPTTIKKSRLYHPHMTENVRETAGTSMETFFLRRILEIIPTDDDKSDGRRHCLPFRGDLGRWSRQEPNWGHRNSRRGTQQGGRKQKTQRRRGMRRNAVMAEARLAVDTGISLNDHISLAVAIEELNANVPLGGISELCNRQLLNRTIEALVDHLIALVATLRSYVDATTADIVITLQALSRLAQSPFAFFPEDLVPRLFDALHELVARQHFLTCYWVLKLLQRYFEPRKSAEARLHRSKALENFVENRLLLYSIMDIIPATSSLSARSSGRWMRSGNSSSHADDDSEAHLQQDLNQTLLFTTEERLEKDMNILTYEALFTLHHVLIYLQAKEKQESESATSSLAKSTILTLQSATPKNWAATIELDDGENDFAIHQEHYNLAASAKREIGEKLLGKYKFLMDAVVDVRLARSCQTIVALISFLVLYFGHDDLKKATAHSVKNERSARPEAQPSRAMALYEMSAEEEYRRKRESSPLRRSSLDYDEDELAENDRGALNRDGARAKTRTNGRSLDELFAFLECYRDDVATLDDRSRLFQEQHTILVPLLGFSQATASDSNGDSIFNVSGMLEDAARLRYEQNESEFMTLDQLEFFDEVNEENQYEETTSRVPVPAPRVTITLPERRRNDAVAPTHPPGEYRVQRGDSEDVRPISQQIRANVYTSNTSISDVSSIVADSSNGSSYVPRFMRDSNFRRLTPQLRSEASAANPLRLLRPSLQPIQQQQQQQQQQPSQQLPIFRPSEDNTSGEMHDAHSDDRGSSGDKSIPPPRTSVALDRRKSAHTCDACIACNDVCESDNCFFCAEKEHQLQLAFAASSSLPRSSSSTSSAFERKFSTCELARHRTKRSCWVAVFGIVYDVTDLLSSHPGGMHVLLNAAKLGEDCGKLFVRKHAPSARRVLENYRLGELYHCKTRTLLLH